MVPQLNIAVLGTPCVQFEQNGSVQTVSEFRTAKARALFFYLAVTRQTHSRLALTGLFWADDREERALTSLRVTLNNLRTLFPDHLEITRQTVRFRTEQPYLLDLDQLAATVAQIGEANGQTSADDPGSKQARDCHEFLRGLNLERAPGFVEWLQAERLRWRQTAISALEQQTTALIEAGHYAAAEPLLRQLLTLAPSHESAHVALMNLLSRRGAFAAALAQYADCRGQLHDALAVDPRPQTQALYERIQAAQLQPLAPLPAPTGPFAGPLVGRQTELAQIQAMLANPACRLVTLVGLGGSGKTRLALAAAHQFKQEPVQRFLNGVGFVPLQGIRSADGLVQALGQALGLSQINGRAALPMLCQALHNRELLLLLDNIEEAMQAADAEESATLLCTLLHSSPHLKLIVTSRQPLELSAEWLLPVDGLPTPDENDPNWQSAPAMQIFLHIAAAGLPAPALATQAAVQIRQICRLVGGLPLAIQLAALRLPTHTLAQIADGLAAGLDLLTTDRPELPARQRSMRTIFDDAWQMLVKPEQTLLGTLAQFRDGFGAASVAPRHATPWALAGLVERSLLRVTTTHQDEPRYVVHPLVAHYALGRQGRSQPGLALR